MGWKRQSHLYRFHFAFSIARNHCLAFLNAIKLGYHLAHFALALFARTFFAARGFVSAPYFY